MSGSSGRPTTGPTPPGRPAPLGRAARLLMALALLIVAGTYLAAQVDYFRRFQPLVPAQRYWPPHIRLIWAPGLIAAALSGLAALVAHQVERRRRDR